MNIPREINGVDITQIGYQAFYQQGINAVAIPNTITVIGDQAFFNNQLQVLTLPESIKVIANFAFVNNRITEIHFPTGITTIGEAAFRGNSMDDSKAFIYNRNSDGTENKTSLNSYAGVNRDHVIIPDQVEVIGVNAFNGQYIKRITLPSHLRIVGASAFCYNSLTEVIFPETVTSIQANAFSNNKITSISLPRNLNTLSGQAFQNNALTNVEFKGTVPGILGIDIFAPSNQLTMHTVKIPVGTLEQYKTAQGSDGNKRYLPSRTWFGTDNESVLDAFYE